jgi:hypothetical protein
VSDEEISGVIVVVVIAVLFIVGVWASALSCSRAGDLRKAQCASAFRAALTASDSLRIQRDDACDLPVKAAS